MVNVIRTDIKLYNSVVSISISSLREIDQHVSKNASQRERFSFCFVLFICFDKIP